jgi:hypothetical protein
LMYVIIVVSFRIVTMSWFHSRENSFRFLRWNVTTTRPLSNGTIEPVSSLISISTVWNRRCNRGQYCIASNTRVIISPSRPSDRGNRGIARVFNWLKCLGGIMHLKPTEGCEISTLIFEKKCGGGVFINIPWKIYQGRQSSCPLLSKLKVVPWSLTDLRA